MLYLNLEKLGILTNYRLLPYDIGYGLRIGLSGATMCGLNSETIPQLYKYISYVLYNGYSENINKKVKTLIVQIKRNRLYD